MTLEKIESTTIEDIRKEFTAYLIENGAKEEEVTDEVLLDMLEAWKIESIAKLEKEILAEEAKLKEVEDRELALIEFEKLSLVHVEKPAIDFTDKTSEDILGIIKSLESQEASIIECDRISEMGKRFDALIDLRACMVKAGHDIPNAKKKRFEAIRDNDVAYLESLELTVDDVVNDALVRGQKETAKELRKTNFKKADKDKVTLKELVLLVQDLME